jgi:hypothetical protein
MKLSEHIADLQSLLETDGDLDVVELDRSHHPDSGVIVRAVRSPRLRQIALVRGGRLRGCEITVNIANGGGEAAEKRAELTGERVYVI